MEERVFFRDVRRKYPDSYIALRNTRREISGHHTGIVVAVTNTYQEAAEKIKPFQATSNISVIEGFNFLNVDRIGGMIFDDPRA